jgi:hypothetical protein
VLESERRQKGIVLTVQSRLCSVWVHRTVRWCTGQCPVRQAGADQLAALGNWTAAYDWNSLDCPVVHRTVRWANGRPHNPRVTCDRANDLMGAPDCPVWTGQCLVRQRLQISNSRLRQNRKAISTGQCPVVHLTVRCATRQKARIAFLDCSQWLLAALGL